MKAVVHRLLPVLGLALSASASAQVWTEQDDAWSFPEGDAQVTRGGVLETIAGSTGAADRRDAYCIKIDDPSSFLATTDPATSSSANADFDTRLFLFRPDGDPVLANDDSPGGSSSLSTLTATATDGSGFVLKQPGKYVLTIGGSPDEPQDSSNVGLFHLSLNPSGVHAGDPTAERFAYWKEQAPATGAYFIALTGARPCQLELDAVFAIRGYPNGYPNQVCLGEGSQVFACHSLSYYRRGDTAGVALGFVDVDAHLDLVFANSTFSNPKRNRLCLGNGSGGFACSDVSSEERSSRAVALGFLNDDQDLDAVFADYERNRICLGTGTGDFVCDDISSYRSASFGVALGFIDGDRNLDAVFANGGDYESSRNQVCLGDGTGGFSCHDVSTARGTRGVALGFVDDDEHLDLVFANPGANILCLGNGQGSFLCAVVSGDEYCSEGLALGHLNGDRHLDAVFANSTRCDGSQPNRVCLGDGSGRFACRNVSDDEGRTKSVALGLISDDSFLDAVFARSDGPNQLCIGDGSGGFTCNDLDSESGGAEAVALGDVAPYLKASLFVDGLETGDTSKWSGVYW